MSYVILARKYRPQTFEELVGQSSVSKTLLNALESGRIAHAYIFSGPRGVGKTTTARVLAKCLNCEKGPAIQPCNRCDSCVTIGQGSSMEDVLEIDGASNRGIEQIRELRENAKYTPSRSRYRIYIIDEAHQITKDAFGALLKTLEEPPAHVIFMMATTEVHKIPAPILSRCQRFSLKPISPDLVFQHLKKICQSEKIVVEDDALRYIVRFVEGSLRDALSLLDQALVYTPEGITTQTLRELLGFLPTDVLQRFADTMNKNDPALLLKTITQYVQEGIELTQLAKDLQNYYHTLILLKAGVEDPLLSASEEQRKQAASYEFFTLERNIRLLARALEEMRRTETPRVVFEITALKMAQRVLDPRILVERLEQLTNKETLLDKRERDVIPALKKKIEADWLRLIEDVANEKQALASALEDADVAFHAQSQTLHLSFTQAFSEKLVVRSFDQLNPYFLKRFGVSFAVKTSLLPASAHPSVISQHHPIKETVLAVASPSLEQDKGGAQLEEVPLSEVTSDIKKVMDFFPGVLKRGVKK